jgi:hypothetical protein
MVVVTAAVVVVVVVVVGVEDTKYGNIILSDRYCLPLRLGLELLLIYLDFHPLMGKG